MTMKLSFSLQFCGVSPSLHGCQKSKFHLSGGDGFSVGRNTRSPAETGNFCCFAIRQREATAFQDGLEYNRCRSAIHFLPQQLRNVSGCFTLVITQPREMSLLLSRRPHCHNQDTGVDYVPHTPADPGPFPSGFRDQLEEEQPYTLQWVEYQGHVAILKQSLGPFYGNPDRCVFFRLCRRWGSWQQLTQHCLWGCRT